MRYRALDGNGDYQINVPFLVNSPQCVAQAILTRLRLWTGEWFLDVTEGTPYLQDILGKKYQNPDIYIKKRILGTTGVTSILSYSSSYSNRIYTITTTVDTLYSVDGNSTVSLSTTL